MKKILMFILALSMGLSITGCGATPQDPQMNEDTNINRDTTDIQNNEYTVRKGTLKGEVISDLLVSEDGIEDASAVVLDNKAIVAVVLSEEEQMTEQKMDRIIQIVKSSDDDISQIAITEEKDLFFKVDDIAQNMMREETTDNVREEFEALINEIGTENI